MSNDTHIGLGTAAIGRPQYINLRQDKQRAITLDEFRQQSLQLLQVAYDLGVRYFDTAPGYGMAEQLMLDWQMQKPKALSIATKWGYTYTADFNPNAAVHEVKEHSLEKLSEQWERSKAFLPQLKYYQIHSATIESGVLENTSVLDQLEDLKQQHNIAIGLTTTGPNQVEVLKRAVEIERNGNRLFELFQVTYNVFDQSLSEIAKDLGTQLVIKEAMANGRVIPNPSYYHYKREYEVLTSMAKKYEVGIDAIALRFCIDSIPVYKVLSGASNIDQLKNNLKANSFTLEQEDILKLKTLRVPPENYWSERKKLRWN